MLLKDVGENGTIVKEIPQDPVWLDPQTERLDRVNRNRATPGNALREFSETYCNFSDKNFVQVFDIYNWKGLLFGRFNFDVLC